MTQKVLTTTTAENKQPTFSIGGPKKTIVKNSAAPLMELSTAQLWRDSLKAGKAAELIAALQADAEGKKLLESLLPPPPVEVINVILVSPDSAIDGVYVSIRWSDLPLWLAELIESSEPTTKPGDADVKAMGGYAIEWEERMNAVEWAEELINDMDDDSVEPILKSLGIDINQDKEEDDDDEDEDDEEKLEPAEWVAENSEKVNDALEEQLVAFFDSSVLVENGISMFDFQRMNMMNMGIISKATIIIDGGNWS